MLVWISLYGSNEKLNYVIKGCQNTSKFLESIYDFVMIFPTAKPLINMWPSSSSSSYI